MKYTLMLTSAIALAGVLHKAKALVDVDESTAKNLLHRGKARLPTDQELAAAGREVPSEDTSPTRAQLDEALAGLPGEYKDPEYVVTNMARHFGDLFTADDEQRVRELVKADASTDANDKAATTATASTTATAKAAAKTGTAKAKK